VVVEARPLSGQPAQQPHLVIVVAGQPLVPAPTGIIPDQAEPLVLARGQALDYLRSRAWLSGELAVHTLILLIQSIL
jgi:hypothetical protein